MLYCAAHARIFPPLWASPTDGQSLINRLIEHTLMLYISHACGESTANSKRSSTKSNGVVKCRPGSACADSAG